MMSLRKQLYSNFLFFRSFFFFFYEYEVYLVYTVVPHCLLNYSGSLLHDCRNSSSHASEGFLWGVGDIGAEPESLS